GENAENSTSRARKHLALTSDGPDGIVIGLEEHATVVIALAIRVDADEGDPVVVVLADVVEVDEDSASGRRISGLDESVEAVAQLLLIENADGRAGVRRMDGAGGDVCTGRDVAGDEGDCAVVVDHRTVVGVVVGSGQRAR